MATSCEESHFLDIGSAKAQKPNIKKPKSQCNEPLNVMNSGKTQLPKSGPASAKASRTVQLSSPNQSLSNLKSLGRPVSPNKSPLNIKSSGLTQVPLKEHSKLSKLGTALTKASKKLPKPTTEQYTTSEGTKSQNKTPPIVMSIGETKSPNEFPLNLKSSWTPVVPQPDTVKLPESEVKPTFCRGGQCIKCVSLISHLTYTPAHNMTPLSVLCKLINLKTKQSLTVRALFDNCSNITVLRRFVADKLKLGLRNVDISFTGTGGSCSLFKDQVEVEFVLQSLNGKYTSPPIQAVTLPSVSHTFQRPALNPREFPHLSGIKDYTEDYTAPPTHQVVDLLIGQPFEPHLGQIRKILGPTIGSPTAITTQLGTCLSVNLPKFAPEDKRNQVSHSTEAHSKQSSIESPKRMASPEAKTPSPKAHTKVVPSPSFAESADNLLLEWMSLDRIALHPRDYPNCDNDLSNEEYEVREKVLAGTSYDKTQKQYVTSLPWKENPITSTNRERAYALSIAWRKKLAVKDLVF